MHIIKNGKEINAIVQVVEQTIDKSSHLICILSNNRHFYVAHLESILMNWFKRIEKTKNRSLKNTRLIN